MKGTFNLKHHLDVFGELNLQCNSPSKSNANLGQPSLEQYLAERTPRPQPKDHLQTSKISHKESNLPIVEGTSPDNSENANSAKGQEVIDLEAENDTALTTRAVANSSIPVRIQDSNI
jgi:hypothetical protein